MKETRALKVTISLPRELLELADEVATEEGVTRSGLVAKLLQERKRERLHALMAEGYRAYAQENLEEAEEALSITRPVVLSDD